MCVSAWMFKPCDFRCDIRYRRWFIWIIISSLHIRRRKVTIVPNTLMLQNRRHGVHTTIQFIERMEGINTSLRSTDRDWTFGNISSAIESCHTGTHSVACCRCLPESLPDEASPTARLSLRRSRSISCQQTDLSILTVWVFPNSLWRCWLIQTSLFYYQDCSNYW